ncbi:hypothetical protein Tsubulata_040572 [Turnera subulata]|uniref:DUF4283 domain-containing protein n=1 Tax=Turnera subulata TaxID=218843 RepID=A0A9Q0G479_9ROSI|nr:hypothetical protein Tsubulata_040572 [Turnera subulata]
MASEPREGDIREAGEKLPPVEVLSDEEEEVLELVDESPAQQPTPRMSLLARVLGTKHVNPQAFSNLMGKIWNPLKGIEAEQLGRNLFLFHFFSKRDRREIPDAETHGFFRSGWWY